MGDILGISVPVKDKIPFRVRPMLATLVDEPFHEPGWVYEEKYDGIRILAYKEGSKVTLLDDLPRIRGATFLSPKLVAQISFTEWTREGKLRRPVFLGLRDDKDPKDVVIPQAPAGEE